jgi:hypothetical protein
MNSILVEPFGQEERHSCETEWRNRSNRIVSKHHEEISNEAKQMYSVRVSC